MSDKPSFPQIPRPVWWGVRAILRRSPGIKLEETLLAAELSVQPAASRQYLSELKRVGLLTEDGTATPLALRWRMDDTYREAADEVLGTSYPEPLVQLAPSGAADRTKVESWFMMQGLGEGTAKNKAGTYIMIANDDPSAAVDAKPSGTKPAPAVRPKARVDAETESQNATRRAAETPARAPRFDGIPLNVNVQIHISAEASAEQIETIFASMRKHLYEANG